MSLWNEFTGKKNKYLYQTIPSPEKRNKRNRNSLQFIVLNH